MLPHWDVTDFARSSMGVIVSLVTLFAVNTVKRLLKMGDTP